MISFHLVEEVTSKRGRGSAFLRHPLTTSRLEPEDAVLPGRITGHGDTAFPGVGRGGATFCQSDRATTVGTLRSDILNSLCGRIGVGIERGLRGSSVGLHGVGSSAVSSVEPAVLAHEFVIAIVCLESCSTRQGVRHGKCARHDFSGSDQARFGADQAGNGKS